MSDKPLTEPPSTDLPDGTAEQPAGEELEVARRERDETYDRLLRKTAEFDNYRKRIERERREQADSSVADLLESLLLVVDDFDRALTVEAGPEAEAYRTGVELIHAKLLDVLRKRGIHAIDSL